MFLSIIIYIIHIAYYLQNQPASSVKYLGVLYRNTIYKARQRFYELRYLLILNFTVQSATKKCYKYVHEFFDEPNMFFHDFQSRLRKIFLATSG